MMTWLCSIHGSPGKSGGRQVSSKEVIQSLTVREKREVGFEPSSVAGRHDSAFPQKHFSHCALILLKLECALASPGRLIKTHMLDPTFSF